MASMNITSLPTEIIIETIWLGMPPSAQRLYDGLLNPFQFRELSLRNRSVIKYLNLITSISSLFRSIALNDARLWSTITWVKPPNIAPKIESEYSRITQYVERSRRALLDILYVGDQLLRSQSEMMWFAVAPHLYRSRRLTVAFSPSARSSLAGRTATLNVCLPIMTPMNSLETLSLSGRLIPDHIPSFQLQGEKPAPLLKELYLDIIDSAATIMLGLTAPSPPSLSKAYFVDDNDEATVPSVYKILWSSRHALQTLRIDYPASYVHEHAFNGPVEFPLLTHLTIAADPNFSFISHLIAPSLLHLCIKRQNPRVTTLIASFITPNSLMWPCLLSLDIVSLPSYSVDWLHTVFLPILRWHGNIQNLDFCIGDDQVDPLIHFLDSPGPFNSDLVGERKEHSSINTAAEYPLTTLPSLRALSLTDAEVWRFDQFPHKERVEAITSLVRYRPALQLTAAFSITRASAKMEATLKEEFRDRVRLKG
ncbi:hypothetical protein DL93DRAFT_1858196 [Clavulina sp. PMI_390]|nr:hypothetical protein DL93DRAFT_1858196 [Clavulina sp. PMI_390]